MKSRLIALDIDWTILDKKTGFPVPDSVREAVCEARKAGVRVCLCSSRPHFFMKDDVEALGEMDALIGCSGAVIDVWGERLFLDRLSPSLTFACYETAKKYGLYNSYVSPGRMLVRKKGRVSLGPDESPYITILEDEELLKTLQEDIPLCSYLYTDPDMPDEILTREPALYGSTISRVGANSFIISNEGVDKGTGVLKLASLWGIPREEILAVGNDANDVPMLKAAGVGVAVANADLQAIAAADWIAPDVRHGGAAAAIRRFAL